jgi:hypothetical protein
MPTKRGPKPVQIEAPVRDAWLRTATPRGPGTWAELKRRFRAFLPAAQSKTLCATLQQWGASPEGPYAPAPAGQRHHPLQRRPSR